MTDSRFRPVSKRTVVVAVVIVGTAIGWLLLPVLLPNHPITKFLGTPPGIVCSFIFFVVFSWGLGKLADICMRKIERHRNGANGGPNA